MPSSDKKRRKIFSPLTLATIFVFITMLIAYILSVVIYFFYLRSDTLESYEKQTNLVKQYISSELSQSVSLNEYDKTDIRLHYLLLQNKMIDRVDFKYERLFITRDALLDKAGLDIDDEEIFVGDVTTNANIGTIEQLSKELYILKVGKEFKEKLAFNIRFQFMKKDFIENKLVKFRFYHHIKQEKTFNIENQLATMYDVLGFGVLEVEYQEHFKYEFQQYATIKYTINKRNLLNQAGDKMNNFIFYSLAFFFLVGILFLIIYKISIYYLEKDMYLAYKYLNENVMALLQNEFYDIDSSQFKEKSLIELSNNIIAISKKVSTVVNEKNIAENVLAKKGITDELTGLPNKKSFEKELQQMFIIKSSAYIGYFKIDGLSRYIKENDSEEINNLIEDLAHNINKFLRGTKSCDAIVYRFYGAVFALVIYSDDIEVINSIMDDIVKITFKLNEYYYFFDNDIHYGVVPFDKYGTVDSILHKATALYEEAKTKDKNYLVLDNSMQLEEDSLNEQIVKDILKRDDFAIRYIFDTYEFEDEESIFMQEASPLLVNSNTFEKFSTGIFIAMAEKLELASSFDKLLIKKVLEQLSMGFIDHKIAVNLSVNSFTDASFTSWLSSELLYNKYANQLVIAVSYHTAIANLEELKNIVTILHEYEVQVLLKRYDLNKYDENSLLEINPQYIRLEKEFTSGIKDDSNKQHLLKKIILFAESNDIKILGDSVKNDSDYKSIRRLSFYGTSR